MTKVYDVLVIGGGVNGCSIAYQLAKRNHKVAVLEKERVGAEASSAAAGMLGAQVEFKEDSPFFEFACESRNMFQELAPELEHLSGVSVSYVKNGMIKLAKSEQDAIELQKVAELQRTAGERVEWLDHSEISRREPALRGNLTGAMAVPDDGQVMAGQLTKAFARSAALLGVEFKEFTRVKKLLLTNGKATGVSSSEGDFYANNIVIAGGAWSADILPTDFDFPQLTPVKGECIAVRPDKPVIRHTIHTEDLYLVPKPDGHIIIGATECRGSFDKRVKMESVRYLTEKACQLVPELAQAELENMWAGVRPQSFDGLPYLGDFTEIEGLWLAAGHYRNGILLSSLTGTWMADRIEGKATSRPDWAEAFNPARYFKKARGVYS